MTGDLLLGTFYAGLFEVLDKKLVAPSTASARIRCPR